jgi:release factor glutamine methyltransferase
MLQIGSAFYALKSELAHLYDEGEATAIAHAVLEHITGLSRLERLSGKESVLTEKQSSQYEYFRSSLAQGTPLQYVIGETLFLNRPFKVSPAVLIPRPETEELVEWIVSDAMPRSILDIGTGSGCIAISLKLAFPGCDVTAIDISSKALEIARQNALQLKAEINFQELNFLDAGDQGRLDHYDVIVSNPPYIPESESDKLHANVRDHEPATALFVPGDNALLFYKAIAVFSKAHLATNGAIYCELHQDYAQQTADLFKAQGYSSVLLRKDLHGNFRMLRASI